MEASNCERYPRSFGHGVGLTRKTRFSPARTRATGADTGTRLDLRTQLQKLPRHHHWPGAQQISCEDQVTPRFTTSCKVTVMLVMFPVCASSVMMCRWDEFSVFGCLLDLPSIILRVGLGFHMLKRTPEEQPWADAHDGQHGGARSCGSWVEHFVITKTMEHICTLMCDMCVPCILHIEILQYVSMSC